MEGEELYNQIRDDAAGKVDVVYNDIRKSASDVTERIEGIRAAAQAKRRTTLTTLWLRFARYRFPCSSAAMPDG